MYIVGNIIVTQLESSYPLIKSQLYHLHHYDLTLNNLTSVPIVYFVLNVPNVLEENEAIMYTLLEC